MVTTALSYSDALLQDRDSRNNCVLTGGARLFGACRGCTASAVYGVGMAGVRVVCAGGDGDSGADSGDGAIAAIEGGGQVVEMFVGWVGKEETYRWK